MNVLDSILHGLYKWVLSFQNINYTKIINCILEIVAVFVVAKLIIHIGNRIILGFFKRQQKARFSFDERKSRTLSTITKSILRYVVYFFAIISILEIIGLKVTMGSFVATAGIGGLALGFGAQNLVKDIVTGFFILFEDQFAVGDYVSIGDITGTVEGIGLRITHIRGDKGELNIIPNGSIQKVTNYTRGNSLAVVDVKVEYDSDICYVIDILKKMTAKFKTSSDYITKAPEVIGITEFTDTGANIRIIAKTIPLKNFEVERILRREIIEVFKNHNIKFAGTRSIMITKDKLS